MRESGRLAAAMVLAAIVGAAGVKVAEPVPDFTPPVEMRTVDVLTPFVVVGQPVRVRIWRDKSRDDCTVTSLRTATDLDADPPLPEPRQPVSWEGGPAGADYLDYSYDTTGLWLARWEYAVRLRYRCADGTVFVIDQPDFFFTIVAEGDPRLTTR